MTDRATPFHCPYCGDQNLWPHEGAHGSWECRSCLRAFTLKMLGIVRPFETARPSPHQEPRNEASS
jgi:ribosomal protein L37AE/L43A